MQKSGSAHQKSQSILKLKFCPNFSQKNLYFSKSLTSTSSQFELAKKKCRHFAQYGTVFHSSCEGHTPRLPACHLKVILGVSNPHFGLDSTTRAIWGDPVFERKYSSRSGHINYWIEGGNEFMGTLNSLLGCLEMGDKVQ